MVVGVSLGIWAERGSCEEGTEPSLGVPRPVTFWISDQDSVDAGDWFDGLEYLGPVRQLQFVLPTPQVQPNTPLPPAAVELSTSLFGLGGLSRSRLPQTRLLGRSVTADFIRGAEANARVTTDTGSLFKKSPSALGIVVQRRTPVVHDPRVRGSRVGALGASGSYWVPARIDLDTALSKIDSRIVEGSVVTPGPYSALYGPGFNFVDVQLLRSPRYESGLETHGSTSVDFNTNGEQWFGRQSAWGGAEDWGVRTSYGHRTGTDYVSGDGTQFGSSYKSRDFDVALGKDLDDDRTIEFNYLRLDQTNVEFPGYAFDMDYLVTDGLDIDFVANHGDWYDQLIIETWYNRTRFAGNAQSRSKRRTFPFLDVIQYVGLTNVDSMSTGFSTRANWGSVDDKLWTAGIDLRFIKQELNEISSGIELGLPISFSDRNSPIPRSFIVNPGLFVEHTMEIGCDTEVAFGARVDLATSDVTDPLIAATGVGLETPQATYEEVMGTDQYQQHFSLFSLYGTSARDVTHNVTLRSNVGYAERPPMLTELYAAQSFMFLLQNGLNTVTGNPHLDHERLLQVDIGVEHENETVRAGVRSFCGVAWDYITYEALSVRAGPPFGAIEQINLKYVNTDLATLAGVEAYLEANRDSWISPFATLKYTDGRDQKRRGEFATTEGMSGAASMQVDGLPRGAFSGIAGADAEPLPGIPPLESRIGIRLSDGTDASAWEVEISARLVDSQDRVASSLLESPTPRFTTFDLRGQWRPRDQVQFVAGVENLTDRTYREHFDLQTQNGISVFQPGVNFYFGTQLTY